MWQTMQTLPESDNGGQGHTREWAGGEVGKERGVWQAQGGDRGRLGAVNFFVLQEWLVGRYGTDGLSRVVSSRRPDLAWWLTRRKRGRCRQTGCRLESWPGVGTLDCGTHTLGVLLVHRWCRNRSRCIKETDNCRAALVSPLSGCWMGESVRERGATP